ncbi:hypothetical protein [Streptomyces sp. NBC_01190]|jgi:hypothetical protein|uniref:hypothetical protein n=1 Tax=Streptomyces sp. NBC_01190 TaxID=2903767 RepID=UPI00386AA246|nr:hypothetical protein OG519_33005 [Streptomyces sp. NBC_01190]
MLVRMLHEKGLRSEHAYLAGFASILASIATWQASLRIEKKGEERADRLSTFVGEWPPTFFALGLALANYEKACHHKH